jgi:hypothetical protein
MWVVVAAVVAAVAIAVAVVGLALGGSDGPTSQEDYQAAVVNARDRTDFALGRLSRAQSVDELLERMDEAAATVRGAAGELDDQGAPEGLEDETDRLVRQLNTLAEDVQGTADQARVPGFEQILFGAGGLNFESWDRINAILVELREQGVVVEPLQRHTTS